MSKDDDVTVTSSNAVPGVGCLGTIYTATDDDGNEGKGWSEEKAREDLEKNADD